jgi:hypothetical protein
MKKPEPIASTVAEAPPAVEAVPVTTAKAAAKLELLDGDEVIQLSIKPSFWFIPLVSLAGIAAAGTLIIAAALAAQHGWRHGLLACQVLIGLAAARLVIATLQWASRLYVLTNRRVMRFKGVLNVNVAECRLSRISAINLCMRPYGRALRLGTIRMQPVDADQPLLTWDDVSRPHEIHEILERAIRKAQP